jgi:GcrA cell cycle regulator
MVWSDERVELLKKLWADGLSASQIAGELDGITRNAVIGKVHRLGLCTRIKSPSTPRVRKPRAHMLRTNRIVRGATASAPVLKAEPPEELVECDIPFGQRRTLLELDDDTCHWPVGDPATAEFFFCGGKPLNGLPYCNYHSRISYQPGNERRHRGSDTPLYR